MTQVTEKPKRTPEEVLRDNAFKPGQSGNPGGKPASARNGINTRFLTAMIKAFDDATEQDGVSAGLKAIRACRDEDPSAYVRALVALQPKELEISRPLDDIPDDQLAAAFAAVGAILAAQNPRAGDCAADGPEAPAGVPAVPEAG